MTTTPTPTSPSSAGLGTESVTVLALSGGARALIVGAVTAIGLGLGIALPFLLGLVERLPWFPYEGPRELLAMISGRVGSWILAVVGTLVGLVVGALVAASVTRIEVSDRDIVVIPDGKEADRSRFAVAQVDQVLIESGHLVLRDASDADLGRWKLEVKESEVIEALQRHGWPHHAAG